MNSSVCYNELQEGTDMDGFFKKVSDKSKAVAKQVEQQAAATKASHDKKVAEQNEAMKVKGSKL